MGVIQVRKYDPRSVNMSMSLFVRIFFHALLSTSMESILCHSTCLYWLLAWWGEADWLLDLIKENAFNMWDKHPLLTLLANAMSFAIVWLLWSLYLTKGQFSHMSCDRLTGIWTVHIHQSKPRKELLQKLFDNKSIWAAYLQI